MPKRVCAAAEPERWVILDAALDRDALQAAVRQVVAERLEARSQTPAVSSGVSTSL